ncbi:protein-L-isoaspartate(D-aspartate) O-methyltransferase [Sphaerisporangium sp. NPDC051017]|uniref:protein-L-isoaspartate O-methyltransferase family protein n=1 Tax=Sphaerisporangium sp. NPDC051017 TaxID=3154636 RepID=UPI003412C161
MDKLSAPDTAAVKEMAQRLADDLRSRGRLTDERWAEALEKVPRHLFTPMAAWAKPDRWQDVGHRIDIATDAAAWWQAVYSDAAIIIQANDGATDPAEGGGRSSSSVSAPGVVFPFLELLAPREGDRILEIGTGSGWTASLLSWWVGADDVTSIEIDPAVAAGAAANIEAAGFAPHLVVGDGLKGCPERAPFDRVHVTAGVADIPAAWIEQTRPGGVIVLPWHPGGATGHKLRVTVVDDSTAAGSFHGRANYMMVRSQRSDHVWNSHHSEDAEASVTRLHPRTVVTADLGAHLASIALAPGVDWLVVSEPDGYSLLLQEAGNPEGSWAACDAVPGADDFQVTQYGSRRLWDEVADAYLKWLSWGSPAADRFGLTIQDDGTRMWLDRPGDMWSLP